MQELNLPGFPDETRYSCITVDQLIDNLRRLLDAAWGVDWGELTEEITVYNNPESTKIPRVVFHLLSRRPNEKLTPLKKRFYESFEDPYYKGYNVEVWRKWYDCKVAFRCYAQTNREARRLANRLEAFIDYYTGYFKEHGLSELIFLGEEEPGNTGLDAGFIPVRTLLYLLRIEEIHVVRGKVLEEVLIKVKNTQDS